MKLSYPIYREAPGNSRLFSFIFILLLMFSTSGFDRFDLVPEVSIGFQNPTEVSETGFRVSWSVNLPGYASLTFILASAPSMDPAVPARERMIFSKPDSSRVRDLHICLPRPI